MEGMKSAKYVGRGMKLPRPLWAGHAPSIHVFINLEALWNPSSWVFMEDSLHRNGWLIMAIDLTSILSPHPGGQVVRWNWKFQPFNHKTGSIGNKPSTLCALQLHQHNKKTPFSLSTLFKTKYIFLTNHNVATWFSLVLKQRKFTQRFSC